jgi:hypothetical protein
MKYLTFILLIFVCACNNPHVAEDIVSAKKKDTVNRDNLYHQTHDWHVDSPFDTVKLLQAFFDPIRVDKKIAIWKPSPEDKLNMNLSDDGYCHTNIDTIIKVPYKKTYRDEVYWVVFTTLVYDNDGVFAGSCHWCGANYGIAELVKDGYTYKVQCFNKNFATMGQSGHKADSLGIQKFGGDQYWDDYALFITSDWQGSGGYFKDIYYYNIDDSRPIHEIFNCRMVDYQSELDEKGNETDDEIDRKITFLPDSERRYASIKIACEHTYENDRKKPVDVKSTTYYYWNYDQKVFQNGKMGKEVFHDKIVNYQ